MQYARTALSALIAMTLASACTTGFKKKAPAGGGEAAAAEGSAADGEPTGEIDPESVDLE